MSEEDSDADSEKEDLNEQVQEVRELPAEELTELEELLEDRPEQCLVCGDEYLHYSQPVNGEVSITHSKDPTCITVIDGDLHLFHHSDVDGPRGLDPIPQGQQVSKDPLRETLDERADDVQSGDYVTFEEHAEGRFSDDFPLRILFSSVSRIRVIEAFTRNASRRLSTDDIARLSDTKPSVARSQTQRLSELGIIEAVDGEENTFELNSDDEIGQLLRQLEGVVLKRLLEGEE